MSKKNKRKGGGQRDSVELLFQQTRRELDKGNARQALKDAKQLYRKEASDTHRALLEEAYAVRVEQLQQTGMPEQARAVYDELIALAVRSPAVQTRLPRLRLILGVTEAGPAGTAPQLAELDPQLLVAMADEALLHPQRVAAAYAELKQQAGVVRQALEAIERGADDAATELLQAVAFKSPFADWKLFARGLSAYYAGDTERTQANWDRLDRQRPAFRIAQTMLVVAAPAKAAAAPFDVTGRLRRLEFAVRRDPTSEYLQKMAAHYADRYWNGVLQTFRSFRLRCGQTHGELLVRVTDMLWRQAARDGSMPRLNRLTALASPPPLDPNWSLARALCIESDGRRDLNQLEDAWKAYIRDLPRVTVLRDDERALAAALVNVRLARDFAQAARQAEEPDFRHRQDEGLVRELRQQAEYYFQQAQRHCPCVPAAHRELAALYLDMDKPNRAAKTYKVMLQEFPDDFEALSWLAAYYVEEDEPGQAEPHVTAAARLRPRDAKTLRLLWSQRLGMVRHCTKKRKYEIARRELESAAAQMPPDTEPAWLDVVRAAVEYKAKNAVAAQRYVDHAVARYQEPTAVCLMMHATAARYNLDRTIKNDYSARFKAAIERPCTSQTAGQMAKFLASFLVDKVKYVGFVTHQRAVSKYLERCRGLAWERDDLWQVCRYAMLDTQRKSWEQHRVLRDLGAVGVALFPDDPRFPYVLGEAEYVDGPLTRNFQEGITQLKRALDLNERAAVRLEPEMVNSAKMMLSMFEDRQQMLERTMAHGPFGGGSDDEYEDDDDDYDDDEYDDDEYDGFATPPPPVKITEEFLRQTVPPALFAQLKQQAKALGLNAIQLLQDVVDGKLTPTDFGRLMETGMADNEF